MGPGPTPRKPSLNPCHLCSPRGPPRHSLQAPCRPQGTDNKIFPPLCLQRKVFSICARLNGSCQPRLSPGSAVLPSAPWKGASDTAFSKYFLEREKRGAHMPIRRTQFFHIKSVRWACSSLERGKGVSNTVFLPTTEKQQQPQAWVTTARCCRGARARTDHAAWRRLRPTDQPQREE